MAAFRVECFCDDNVNGDSNNGDGSDSSVASFSGDSHGKGVQNNGGGIDHSIGYSGNDKGRDIYGHADRNFMFITNRAGCARRIGDSGGRDIADS